MRSGAVDLVIVGADRIAANGDVANKLGTYSLTRTVRHHSVPFYVAAPWSMVDLAASIGRDIMIEHRHADKIGEWRGSPTALAGVGVNNPAFAITPPLTFAGALDAHCQRLAACRRCANGPGVLPIVSLARAPRAMLVGQAPGKTEMSGGRAFAGPAGTTLFTWLARAGLDEPAARQLLYISAITRCYPGPHPSGRGDRVPSPSERNRCGDWLADELRIIRPALIVPVGRLAIARFLGAVSLDEVVGREHRVEHAGGESIVIPLPHPSGASSWIHAPPHRALLDRSLALLGERLHTRNATRRSVA